METSTHEVSASNGRLFLFLLVVLETSSSSCSEGSALPVQLNSMTLSSSSRPLTAAGRRPTHTSAMRRYMECHSYSSLDELKSASRDCSYHFFSHTLCPYAERVWLAIEELPEVASNTALVHVDLSRKPSWFREVSPRGLVPTVLHDGQVHVESMDIVEWLLKDTVQNPAVSSITSVALDACGGNAGSWRVGTSISQRQLDSLEQACARILKEDMPLVEKLAVFPFLYRTKVVLKHAYGIEMDEMDEGKVGAWMEAMMQRPSAAMTSADGASFGRAMKDGGLDFFDFRTTSMFEFHPHILNSET